MKLQLRPRQERVLNEVAAAFREGYRSVMVYAPCGFGKTEIATAMLLATHQNGKHGQFLADRISLVNQTSGRFDKYGLPHGIMQADNPRYAPSEPIQVCSIATLQRRRWPSGHLMMVDEAHTLPEAVRRKLKERDRYSVGLSATPVTPGLAEYFDVVVCACTTNELIAEGALVPPHIFSFDQPDMNGVPVSGGEWSVSEGEERVMQVVGDVVTTYVEHGEGLKFVCFAWNIRHAEELQRQFLAAGINAATYTADDDIDDRNADVEEFRRPDSSIRGLITVKALTRGFDVTDVGVLIDARPIRTAWWDYVQMLGRVMRAHEGKTRALVFDHSGNAIYFWKLWQHLFEHGVHELDDGTRRDEKGAEVGEEQPEQPRKCPKCKTVQPPRPVCPHCGFEFPKAGAVAHVPGTLKELIQTGDKALMKRELWPQVVGLVLEKAADPVQAERRAQAIYRELTGSYSNARFADTTPAEPSAQLRGKVKANAIRFAKGKQKAAKAAGVPA